MSSADGADPSSPQNPGSNPVAADRLGQTADSVRSAQGEGLPAQYQVTPDPAQPAHAKTELSQEDAADEPGGGRTGRLAAWSTTAQQQQKLRQYQEKLERHRQVGFLLQSARRVQQDRG